jgi:hypothetical protein
MDIHKFRPNIIVSGAPAAYDEDFWAQLAFPGNLKMNFGGTCWRCQAITVDLKTGKKAEGEEGEVWKKLAKDRRVDKGWKYGPVFGKYSYTSLKDVGRTISVSDEAVLTKRVREQPTFGESCLVLALSRANHNVQTGRCRRQSLTPLPETHAHSGSTILTQLFFIAICATTQSTSTYEAMTTSAAQAKLIAFDMLLTRWNLFASYIVATPLVIVGQEAQAI